MANGLTSHPVSVSLFLSARFVDPEISLQLLLKSIYRSVLLSPLSEKILWILIAPIILRSYFEFLCATLAFHYTKFNSKSSSSV